MSGIQGMTSLSAPKRPPRLQALARWWQWRRATKQGTSLLERLRRPLVVSTPAGRLSFVLLGPVAAARALSVVTKQPETLVWIDRFEPGSVFWDVGANVGVYTLYAARRGSSRIIAIEPAAVNYFLLAANCEANALHDRVDCLALGLGAGRSISRLEVSQFAAGRSFSFEEKSKYPTRQAALVLSMDELVEEYGLPCPNYVKIDVPAMTEPIIAGASRTLRRPEVREVHIELRVQSKAGRRIADALGQCGLMPSGHHTHGATTDVTFSRRSSTEANLGAR